MARYRDGTLSGAERARLEGHLADCPRCSEHLAQPRVTIETPGRVEADDLPDDALGELVSLYRRWQADCSAICNAPAAQRTSPRTSTKGEAMSFIQTIELRTKEHEALRALGDKSIAASGKATAAYQAARDEHVPAVVTS